MKKPACPVVMFVALVLAGCVGKLPPTADEFRRELPGAFTGVHGLTFPCSLLLSHHYVTSSPHRVCRRQSAR
jgi:hypothetical protein